MQNNRSWLWFFVGVVLIFMGWGWVREQIWGPPAPPAEPPPTREAALALGGSGVAAADWVRSMPGEALPAATEPERARADEPGPVIEPAPDAPKTPPELISLGGGELDDGWYLRVLLNKRGGGVQQVVLTDFQDANRLGLPVFDDAEKTVKRPLHLIPGVRTPHPKYMRDDPLPPMLKPGPVPDDIDLYPPSFAMYHYADPKQERPEHTLGTRDWDVVRNEPTEEGHEIVFQTDLGAPHHVRVRKTFTLKKHEYHVGLDVKIEPTDDRPAGARPFRYQVSGPFGLPIEGEWYTHSYRNALIGYRSPAGTGVRELVDAASIQHAKGSRRFSSGENKIQYAAVAIQYFASAVVVDDTQDRTDFLEFVRATYEETDPTIFRYAQDFTVRTISRPIEFDEDGGVEHRYLLYNGPAKVRLLGHLTTPTGEDKVDPHLVERYHDELNLYTFTDYHSPNFFGRMADAIFWSDLIIAMTNFMHWILGGIYEWVPYMGVCVLILTVMVRGALHPLSRRQAKSAAEMQEKMGKVKPEMQKINEKFKDDMQAKQVAMMELYRKHGINPFAMMGGCFLLLLQMPIFMGLYFCLNESIFFRLESFLWMPNLAAPDMLFWWSEHLPVISDPDSRAGFFGFLYLGPFFNILPILAVALMIVQQKMFMPPPADEQQEMQQKMMKYMMIMFAVFFYKIAAGVAIYFIASTLWGVTERKLLPKPKPKSPEDPDPKAGPKPGAVQARKAKGKKGNEKAKKQEPQGFIGRMKARWEEILEEAKKKQ